MQSTNIHARGISLAPPHMCPSRSQPSTTSSTSSATACVCVCACERVCVHACASRAPANRCPLPQLQLPRPLQPHWPRRARLHPPPLLAYHFPWRGHASNSTTSQADAPPPGDSNTPTLALALTSSSSSLGTAALYLLLKSPPYLYPSATPQARLQVATRGLWTKKRQARGKDLCLSCAAAPAVSSSSPTSLSLSTSSSQSPSACKVANSPCNQSEPLLDESAMPKPAALTGEAEARQRAAEHGSFLHPRLCSQRTWSIHGPKSRGPVYI